MPQLTRQCTACCPVPGPHGWDPVVRTPVARRCAAASRQTRSGDVIRLILGPVLRNEGYDSSAYPPRHFTLPRAVSPIRKRSAGESIAFGPHSPSTLCGATRTCRPRASCRTSLPRDRHHRNLVTFAQFAHSSTRSDNIKSARHVHRCGVAENRQCLQ